MISLLLTVPLNLGDLKPVSCWPWLATIPVHRTLLWRQLVTQEGWLVTPLITITQTRKITFIWPPQKIWSFQKPWQQRWSRYWSVGILQLVSLVQSCQPSERAWLLHPSRNTFLSVPESSFCCHEHNKGNGYSLKLGLLTRTFLLTFILNPYPQTWNVGLILAIASCSVEQLILHGKEVLAQRYQSKF